MPSKVSVKEITRVGKFNGCRMVGLRERCAFHEAGHATAGLAYGIPIVAVTIAAETPHLHRAHYRAPHDLGLETLVTLCLAGPAAEELFFWLNRRRWRSRRLCDGARVLVASS
jgi:hypothetical protein